MEYREEEDNNIAIFGAREQKLKYRPDDSTG